MADSILRLRVDSQEYDAKLKRAADGLQRYADGCRKVGGTLEVVEKETLDFVKAIGQMETTSKSAKGSLNEMTKAYNDLYMVYKKMTDAEKNSPLGKELAASLDQLKVRIKDTKSDLDEVNRSLTGSGGLTGALDAVAGKFGLSIDQLTKFGGVAAIATTAVNVAKDAFFESETNIDEWNRTMEGARGAYEVFLDTLNNGNWSGFFQNLNEAIRGGRELYNTLDRLGSIKSNNAAAIAIVQQNIAQLRLAKQSGEDVDDQIKKETAKLSALQKQSINAGKAAGSQTAFNVIRNGVNSVGGAKINDATINYAVDLIMKNGQSEIDKYRRNRDILRERGMVTRTQTIQDSQGGTYERQYKVFDINALNKEQQKQYAIAQAITEGETRLQKGIQLYAQAIQEGTASAREEFKGNRYANQGSGSGGGRGGNNTIASMSEEQANNLAIQRLTTEYVQATEERQEAIREEIKTLQERNAVIKQMKDEALGKYKPIEPMGEAEGIMPSFYSKPTQTLQEAQFPTKTQLDVLNDELKKLIAFRDQSMTSDEYKNRDFFVKNKQAEIDDYMGRSKKSGTSSKEAIDKLTNKMSTLSSGITSITSGLQAMNVNIPEELQEAINVVNGMISVIQGVSAIISVFSTGAENANTIATVANTTALGALTTAMIANTTVNAIPFFRGGGVAHAAQGFVPGNNHNDNIPIMVSSGELILNRAQQGNIASQLEGNGLQNLHLEAVLRGEDMRLSLNNNGRRTGRGEYVTTNFRRYGTGY